MAGVNNVPSGRNTQKMSMTRGWDTERWVAVLVIGALALLIAIRLGFRGVNVMGVRASMG